MLRFIKVTGIAFGTVALTAGSVLAAEYQCQREDSALRIAIEVKKAGHTLPCEVIAEDDRGERAVLYSAQFDRDYCPGRLEKTRSELEEEGWACQLSSNTNVVQGTSTVRPVGELAAANLRVDTQPAATAVAASGATVSDSRICRQGDALRRLRIQVEDPERGKPCELIYWSEDDQSEAGELLWRAEHDSDFCPKRLDFIVQKWDAEGWRCESGDPSLEASLQTDVETETAEPETVAEKPTQEPAQEPASTSIRPAQATTPTTEIDPKLKEVIEADARRIGEWMEVEPNIEVAAQGDLNADGSDDAVVFLAYQSDQAAYRQYLMSYLVADESYELASVKLLTGVNPPPEQARVEQIDEGVIWLSLPEEDGRRLEPTGFILRNQQLVEVDPPQQPETSAN